jgi:predicted metalloprotease
MSDNWKPPPERDEPEPAGKQPTEPPAQPPSRGDGQSPLWWTQPAEKPQEYLQPGPPASAPQQPATPDQPTAPTGPSQDGWGTGWSNPTWDRPPYSDQQPPRGQHAAPPNPPPGGPAPSGPPASGPSASGPGHPVTPRHQGPTGPGTQAPGGSTPPVAGGPPSPWSTAPQGGQANPWSAAASSSYPPFQPGVQQGGQAGFQGFPPGGSNQGGQPSWQYPPIPIPKPPGGGRRRKQRRTPKGLLIGLVVLAVLVVGSGVTYALRNSGDDTKTTTTDTPSVVASETPSETPSASPTPTPTPTTKPTPKPPKPRQLTPYEVVAKNKLYTVGTLQASRCTEPPYRPTTFAAVKAYYNRMLPCLNRTWWLAMKKAGMPFRSPHVIVYANTVKTPCGIERGTRGFYCGANEAIYMPFNVDYNNYKVNPMYTRAWMLNTFAHEYGHHVQQLTGIFAASFARQATMADPAMRLLESRKRELQASCLGSAYLGADAKFIPLTGELLASWKFAVANAGDEFSKPKVRDHGAKVNHNFWSTRGIGFRDPRYCNTFQSPPQFTY